MSNMAAHAGAGLELGHEKRRAERRGRRVGGGHAWGIKAERSGKSSTLGRPEASR